MVDQLLLFLLIKYLANVSSDCFERITANWTKNINDCLCETGTNMSGYGDDNGQKKAAPAMIA